MRTFRRIAPISRSPALPEADDALEALEARMTELEIKLAFAEDTVESLNATVFRQQQQIEALIQELRALREQLRSNHPAEARSLQDDIPPHY